MSDDFNFPSLMGQYQLDLSQYTDRQKIELMEWVMLKTVDNIAADLPVDDYIHAGMYYRALSIPAGTVLTGKVHFDDHICILEQGDLSVMTDSGMKRLHAPCSFPATAGSKKIGYAHTDVRFSTVHKTDSETCQDAEEKHFADSDLAWVDDLFDFKAFLLESGLDEQWVWDISRNTEDMLDVPDLTYKIKLGESKIQGTGGFATEAIEPGDLIAQARIGDKRTIAGRYINHSMTPNAIMIMHENRDMDLIAIDAINPDDEITIDYREALLCQLQA